MRKLGLRGRRQVLRFEQREYQKIKLEKVGLQWDLQSKYNLKKVLSWDKKKQDVDVGELGVGGGCWLPSKHQEEQNIALGWTSTTRDDVYLGPSQEPLGCSHSVQRISTTSRCLCHKVRTRDIKIK